MSTIGALIRESAHRFAPRVALRQGGRALTYAELWERVERLGSALLELGMRPGARVFLLSDNRLEWLICDLAALAIGCADVPRGGSSSPAELRRLLRHSEAELLIVESPRLLARLGELPPLRAVVLMEGEAPGALRLEELLRTSPHGFAERLERVRPEDLATILYTSGTTGEPKGVMLLQRNLVANLQQATEVLEIHPQDRFLAILPLWHAFERMVEYIALSRGAEVVYTDLRHLAQDLRRHRPTVFPAVPRIWEAIARRASLPRWMVWAGCQWRRRRHPLSLLPFLVGELLAFRRVRRALGGRLRLGISGGGSLPLEVDRLLLACGVTLLNGYGLSEASPIVSVRTPEHNALGTAGRPLPRTEVDVREGVLWVRGPQVMAGYWRNPRATAEALREGWLNTGDLARITPEGDLVITGRAKDTIVLLGGENVEPEPLEELLCASPYIEDAVVVGQDRKQLAALIVPAEPLRRLPPGEAHEVVRREVQRLVNRNPALRPEERIGPVALLERPLAEETLQGEPLLTPTLKKRRFLIERRYRELIDRLYRHPS